MNTEQIIRDFPKGLLVWYEFKEDAKVLFISDNKDDAVYELLQEKCAVVDIYPPEKTITPYFKNKHKQDYDYIIAICVLETLKEPVNFLKKWKPLVKENGHLLLGTENRLGIKYFCGDRDPFTERSFDGIEHYHHISAKDWEQLEGRCYSKAELEAMLDAAGFDEHHFYSVMPNLIQPQLIYSENYLPNENLAIRYFPLYNHPDSVFLEEEYLYSDLADNGIFHALANAYLIDCSDALETNLYWHITLSNDRGPENSFATIIMGADWNDRPGLVVKRPLYKEGFNKVDTIMKHWEDLRKHNVPMLFHKKEKNNLISFYMDAPNGVDYLRNLAKENKTKFIYAMDNLRNTILNSSESYYDEEKGVILERGYIDLVPLNSFFFDGKLYFFDQEFCYENLPADVIIYRSLMILYMSPADQYLEQCVPLNFFLERYNLKDKMKFLEKISSEFIKKLRNTDSLRDYMSAKKPNGFTINSNRQRINYSNEQYKKIFLDLLHDTDNKKIIVFGSGIFAKRFVSQFERDCDIYAIVDNNENRWGEKIGNIEICSPDIIKQFTPEEVKIIICVKSYAGIVRQVKKIGDYDYSIYDSYLEYETKPKIQFEAVTPPVSTKEVQPKKYNVGYIAGVFDLFHVGHLNMFKRAKEQCNYLIVGVVSDEGVRKNKGVEPFIPFDERLEMVSSCKYVDKAVEIPYELCGTKDAHRMYKFDVQFSGSDYINNSSWLEEKDYLEKHGAALVFFPYTEKTSSSKIKALIDKKMI